MVGREGKKIHKNINLNSEINLILWVKAWVGWLSDLRMLIIGFFDLFPKILRCQKLFSIVKNETIFDTLVFLVEDERKFDFIPT